VGVAEWETAMVEELSTDLQASLPTVEEIEAELGQHAGRVIHSAVASMFT
jgi:hypothetical protein